MDESEAILARVRAEIDTAWDATYRSFGILFVGMAMFFLLSVLHQNPSNFEGSWAVIYYLSWVVPVLFFVEGALYFRSPRQFRAFQTRYAAWWRRRFLRTKISDSRMAEMVNHLQMMRKEIDRIETTIAATTAGAIVLALVFGLIGALTVGSTYQLIVGVNPDLARVIGLAVATAACISLGAFLLLRARVNLSRAWQLSLGLTRCNDFLGTLETRFLARK